MITRHFLDVGNRRVHYRKAGNGPPLLMVHQSPRSSAEYLPLIERWAPHFTCIAPDTPGYGHSDPLPDSGHRPEIGDFADAIVAFLDAAGIQRTAAYGFHSGGIILASALKRHPERFSALAVGGYAVWTDAEMALFGEHYLPPFRPSAYGEHLSWAWNRILEQSWFFPWFAVDGTHRMSVAHDDPARVDATLRDLLDSGDAYRAGYGAVLRSASDLPEPGATVPPALITAYNGDPLQAHIGRMGKLPAGWEAYPVATPEAHQQASLEFLLAHGETAAVTPRESADQGFLHVETAQFNGLIRWKGNPAAERCTLHAPGQSLDLVGASELAIDMPGHGLSDDWATAHPEGWAAWAEVLQAVQRALGFARLSIPAPLAGDAEPLFPDLRPDRFGTHLTAAWQIVRARTFFAPWYQASAANAVAFTPADITPERLARAHLSLLRARAARAYQRALSSRPA